MSILKAKKRTGRISPALLREIEKDDNKKAIYAKVSAKLYKKLKRELMDREIEMQEWIEEKISEI